MICRQQRKNQTAKDEEEFEGPPEYKPPPPTLKLQTGQGKEEELLQLKPTVQHIETKDELESTPPKYRQLSESELPSALDDDYREEMNPIYNELTFEEPGSYPRDEQGFMMSPAVYV